MAEDAGFEPAIGFPIHAFQACALGHYANPPRGSIRGFKARPPIPVSRQFGAPCGRHTQIHSVCARLYAFPRSPARRHRAELPQGRKAARVRTLCRVRGGSFTKGAYARPLPEVPAVALCRRHWARARHRPTLQCAEQRSHSSRLSLLRPSWLRKDIERAHFGSFSQLRAGSHS